MTTADASPSISKALDTQHPLDAGVPAAAPSSDALDASIDRAVASLFRKLKHDPRTPRTPLHWCAELEGDSILASEYLLMKLILEQDQPDDAEERRRLVRIANQLRLSQRRDGTWGQYPDSPADISACVKAYFCLKVFGDDIDAPHMQAAREQILALGGAERSNTFSMFYLACLGQVSWEACPAIPPEIVLFPRWFPFHLDKVSAWTRTMILPLAICSAMRPVRNLPREWHIDELFINQSMRAKLNQSISRDDPASLRNFFLACDAFLKRLQALHPPVFKGVRQKAIRKAESWILERVDPETTEGLGAIFPPMVYLQIAFKALGYERSHPVIQQAERDLDDFMIDCPHEDPTLDHIRIQPCFSPVWDTGIALYAMTEAGLTADSDERVAGVCDWLREKRVRRDGDWVRNLRPEDRARISLERDEAAWAFEYRNEWYPDVDDTAMIAKALWRAGDRPGESVNRDTAQAAIRWILAMQNDDGGWAAFDRTTDRAWMELVPFADHNAMQDPSCADITGRTIESLTTCGLPTSHPAVQSAVRYLLAHQHDDGCWFGRWGVNYIYGTWQALGGLAHAGVPKDHPAVRSARAWLVSIQNEDGGFGESANSYLNDDTSGTGPSTPSQTAWALAALLFTTTPDDLARDDTTRHAADRAAAWLMDHQLDEDKPAFVHAQTTSGADSPDADRFAATDIVEDLEGGWNDHHFTGTGFPRVFYLRYHCYRHYFPVMSLARYRSARHAANIG